MLALLAPIIVLIVSLIVLILFLSRFLMVWLDMTCFWGRVNYRMLTKDNQPDRIEYSFTFPQWMLIATPCAFAGMLWSVIRLATLA